MRFESPWALIALLAVPAVVFLYRRARWGGSVRFSSTRHAALAGRSLRQKLGFAPLVLRVVALILLVIALARPRQGTERIVDASKGIAIEMVVDRSSSMRQEMEFEGETLNRLEVVKRVFAEFVKGSIHGLKGRPNDLTGMITFARYADTICPLTLGHGALAKFLENVQLVKRSAEDGTAIGDALALAAARLKTAEDTLAAGALKQESKYEIKAKVIILLTDGENNAGKRTPIEAAKLAKKWGVKIYAIGVGGRPEGRGDPFFDPFGFRFGPMVDEDALREIAETTGGIFRMADDEVSLRAIYKEIDKLEKSEIRSVRYLEYRERFMGFAVTALVLIVLEVGLTCTVFRRIP